MTRVPLVAGNWKLNKGPAEAAAFMAELLPLVDEADGVDVGVCPPFPSLPAVTEATRGTAVQVYAQTMHDADSGAFTGEVSAPMLVEVGVDGVVLGHSERRHLFGETDRALAKKVPRALEAGLKPILCVGETEEERDADETERRLRQQVQDDLAEVPEESLAELVIAYEPVWAIGTGRDATPDQAQEAIGFVRALVRDRSPAAADAVRVLYGGSVSPDNASELLALPDVDGALVGGASLDAASFAAVVAAAAPSR